MRNTRTRKAQRHNPEQVKDAVLRGRVVEASNGWMLRINDNDMVELWPPGDHDGMMTHLGHLDRAVADFCKKADMPIPKVNETQGDQVKLPGDAQSILGPDSGSKEPKGKFKPEINKRPTMTDQKGTSKPDTSLGPDSTSKGLKNFDPAINKRPRPNVEEGGLPDTSLGADTSGAPTNWGDRRVRIQEDGRNRMGRRRGQALPSLSQEEAEDPGFSGSGLGARLKQLMNNFQTNIYVEDRPDGTVHIFDANFDMIVDPFIAISELQRLPVGSDDTAVWDALGEAGMMSPEMPEWAARRRRRSLHDPKKPKRGPGQLGVGKAQMGEEAPTAAPGVAARRRAEEDPFNVKHVEEPGKKLNKGETPSDPEEVISQSKGEKKELREEKEGRIRDSFEDATPDPTAIYQDLRRARPSEDILRDIMDPQKWAANNIFMPSNQSKRNQRRAQLFEDEEEFMGYEGEEGDPEQLYGYIEDLKRVADETGNDEMFDLLRSAEQAMESGDYAEAFDYAEQAEAALDESKWKVAYRRRRAAVLKYAQWALGDDSTSEAIAYLVNQGYDELAASEIINAYMAGDVLDFQAAYLAEEALAQAGKAARKRAVAPKGEGWERVTKELKDEPDVDNPYALANWMKGQGYKPKEQGGGKKKSRRTAGPKLKENWGGDGAYTREIGAESAEELHALTMALGGDEVDWSKFKPAQPDGAPVEEGGSVDEQSAQAEPTMPVQASEGEPARPFDEDVQDEPSLGESLDSAVPARGGRKQAAFMEPKVIFDEWVWDEEGSEYIPAEYSEGSEERIEGYGAYMSAPGYLDRTDVDVFETEEEAWDHLFDNYMTDMGELDSEYDDWGAEYDAYLERKGETRPRSTPRRGRYKQAISLPPAEKLGDMETLYYHLQAEGGYEGELVDAVEQAFEQWMESGREDVGGFAELEMNFPELSGLEELVGELQQLEKTTEEGKVREVSEAEKREQEGREKEEWRRQNPGKALYREMEGTYETAYAESGYDDDAVAQADMALDALYRNDLRSALTYAQEAEAINDAWMSFRDEIEGVLEGRTAAKECGEREEKEAVDPEAEQYWSGYMGEYGKQLSEGDTGDKKPGGKGPGKGPGRGPGKGPGWMKGKEKPKKPDLNDPGYKARRAAYLRARRYAQETAPLAQPVPPPATPAAPAKPAPGAPGAPAAPGAPGAAPAAPAKPQGLPPGTGDSGLQTLGWTPEDIAVMDEEDKKKILEVQLNKPGTKKKPLTPGEKPGEKPTAPAPKTPQPAPGAPAPSAPGAVPSPAAPGELPMTPAARVRLAKLIMRKINRRKVMAQAARPTMPGQQPAAPVQAPLPEAPAAEPSPAPGTPAAEPPPGAGPGATLPEFDKGEGGAEASPEEKALQILSEVQEMEVSATTPGQVPSLKASYLARKLLTELGMTVQDAKKLYGLGTQKGLTSLFE